MYEHFTIYAADKLDLCDVVRAADTLLTCLNESAAEWRVGVMPAGNRVWEHSFDDWPAGTQSQPHCIPCGLCKKGTNHPLHTVVVWYTGRDSARTRKQRNRRCWSDEVCTWSHAGHVQHVADLNSQMDEMHCPRLCLVVAYYCLLLSYTLCFGRCIENETASRIWPLEVILKVCLMLVLTWLNYTAMIKAVSSSWRDMLRTVVMC